MKASGVAIFGPAGAGKTTLARSITFNNFEASDVINIAADTNSLDEKEFIKCIVEKSKDTHIKKLSREDAIKTHLRIIANYSPEIVSKIFIALESIRKHSDLPVIAGIRGYRNAIYLKKHGYQIIYVDHLDATQRVAERDSIPIEKAREDYAYEESIFQTCRIHEFADMSFWHSNTEDIAAFILAKHGEKECKTCANTTMNPSITIDEFGLCNVCKHYKYNQLLADTKLLLELKNKQAMVGLSGGKDSTATLFLAKQIGFNISAFSFDLGYYPEHIFNRSRWAAKALDIPYERIDIRGHIRESDRNCYRKTADLYESDIFQEFRNWYKIGREYYSVKNDNEIPFVRTCQLCRRVVVRAYYEEARKRGVDVVILGMNEWTGLSGKSGINPYSGIRKLDPTGSNPVYIIHLPYLCQRTLENTKRTIELLGWKKPKGEDFVETNANSCLFARAAESKAIRMLGFHPDTTRLSREVTVGFLSKEQAKIALEKHHPSELSVREVLETANII